MADRFYTIRGEMFYAKVLGNPVPNYNGDGKEWTLELKPDKDGLKLLKELGVADRITKGEKKDRILFRQREKKPDGSFNKRISVYGPDNLPWDNDKLIGNKSIGDVKFYFVDYGKGKFAGVYPHAVRVLEHVEYVKKEFAPLTEDDKYFKESQGDEFHKDFDTGFPEEVKEDVPEVEGEVVE